MADRVVGAMDDAVREAPKNGAYLPGLMKQDELAQYGVELTPGRAAMVNAPDSRAYAAAQDLMRQEDLTRGLPSALPAARRMQGMLDQSETAMTRATQRQLGLPENTLMTNKVLGDNLEVLGKQYDDITGRAGKVVLDDAVRADMAQALEAATDASRSVIEKKISTFESLAEKHGNAIPADIFRTEMSNLNRIIRKTTDYVKAGELEELQKALTEGLGNSLSAADRDLLHEVNRKYALSMTLNKPGVISGGKVESGPFMRNWRGSRPSRIMNAQNDPLTRVAETLNYVNSNQAVPGKTSLRQAGLGALDARTGGLATPALGLAGAGVGGYFLGQ
jgi:RNase P/RNase MRP subunit p29